MHTDPKDPPQVTPEDEEILAHPEDGYPTDAPPEEIDRAQFRQAEALEHEKAWVDPTEITGGDE